MKGTSLLDTFIGGALLVGLVYWLWLAFMAVLIPVVLVSIMRSLKAIRRQLEVLNDRGPGERAGAPGRLIAP